MHEMPFNQLGIADKMLIMPPIPKPKRARTKHYFAEWRRHRGLNQDQAAGRLGWSQSKISRLENGETPYDQDDLENGAHAYSCSPSDLLSVNPLKEGDVVDISDIFRKMSDEDRTKAVAVLKAFSSN